MIRPEQHDAIVRELDAALSSAADLAAEAMRIIARTLPHYHWVGLYWLEGSMLRLGPFVGAPTDHTQIAIGQGVCGTAVAEDANQIVADVRTLQNYLACSAATRSEIVVLIRDQQGKAIGQIDADSHATNAFDASDEQMLEQFAQRLAPFAPVSRAK